MPRRIELMAVLLCMMAFFRIDASAQGERPWAFALTINESFDDNRDGVPDGKESNLDTRVIPRADLKLHRDQTDFDLFYAPQICFRSNPRSDQKSTDLYHDLGINVAHRWSPRLRVDVAEAFNLSDTPAEMLSSRTFHEFVTYWVNRVNVAASYELLPARSVLIVRGNHMVKKYREDEFADIGDESDLGAGLSGKYMLRSGWNLLGDIAYETTDLGESDAVISRSADVFFAGAGVERVFGLWTARARAGIDITDYEIGDDSYSDSSPGCDIDLEYVPTDATRLALNAGYHILRSDVAQASVQQRTSISVSADHNFTKRLGVGLQGAYGVGRYDFDGQAGGDDKVAAVGAGVTYALNRNMTLGAGYRFEDWNTDETIPRPSYTRNVCDLSVKAQF